MTNRPKPPHEVERAERLPGRLRGPLRGVVPGADGRPREQADPWVDAERHADGVLLQSLSGDDRDEGEAAPPGEIRKGADFRRLVRRSGVDVRIPPRGIVLAPWSFKVSEKSWPKPSGKLSAEAERLLDDFARRRAIEVGMGLGMTQGRAARAVGGVEKSRGSTIMREAKEAGGASAWFRREAVRLIWAGRTPHGRDTIRSHDADAFFRNLIDAPELERWVYRVGYRSDVDERALDESMAGLDRHEREAVEYLIQSGHLWDLYP